jgi:hypothetical protein
MPLFLKPHSMQTLFLSYANSQQHPLPTLQEEDERIYQMLARREVERHFRLHRDSFTTIPKISEYLALFQDDIALFHYSGHAGKDQLLLDDAAANAAGIAQLLGRCPNLKLVVLNGCSTRGQVQALLEAGVPVVIATSAAVDDRTATQFGISFFQAMADSLRSIGDAFQDAVASAQTQSGQTLKAEKVRGLALRKDDRRAAEPLWGLYYREESDLEWKLPLAVYAPPAEYIPNEQLISKLVEALAPFNEEVRKLKEQEDLGVEPSAGQKKKAILKCLPHPVSQQLRKLMSKEKGIEEHVFYDKAGPDRLRQIGHTYSTLIELLAFSMLADLWQKLEKKTDLQLSASDLATLLDFFVRPADRKKPFNFLPLIRGIRQIMEQNELPFFIEEFSEVSRNFNADTAFAAACRFLEALRQRMVEKSGLNEAEAFQLCPSAEEKLATVFGQLGFLAAYSLTSVRRINVLKFRYPPTPMFNHQVIHLAQEFMELEERPEVLDKFMDAASVLLQRKKGDTYRFLNLSPFVIDESAFDEKAELAKLLFFERYEKPLDAQRFRHVYKPGDLPLVITDQKHFRVLRAQFDAFSRSLFQKTLKDL